VLDYYIRGLRNPALVDRLIMETDPATLDEAFITVAEFIAREERKKRVLRKGYEPTTEVEPMEVGAVAATPSSDPPRLQEVAATSATPDSQVADALINIARQMQGMQKEISKLKATSIAQIAINAAAATGPLKGTTQQVAQPTGNQNTRTNNGRQPRYPFHTPDGTIVCYECGSAGHIGKDCERRRARFATQNSTSNSGNY
jgi:hypothetical protein